MKMAKVEIPHVQSFKDRHGKARYYYRRKGFARVKLPVSAVSTNGTDLRL